MSQKRKSKSKEQVASSNSKDDSKNKQIEPNELYGVTKKGDRFKMPYLKDPFTLLPPGAWGPSQWIKQLSLLNFALLLFPLPGWFFVVWFFFWRLAYNFGIGYLLHIQSSNQSFTKYYSSMRKNNSSLFQMLKKWIISDMSDDYKFEEYPDEFNAWLLFRIIVDIILANDLIVYFVFAVKYFVVPEQLSLYVAARYIVGILLCAFALWGKTDAYRVIGSFAWYWGDFFYLVDQHLTFDRVFAIAPHPMYTLGYSFFYGTSLICDSYTVFAVSLVGHVAQMLFLMLVESPHIEKTYNSIQQQADDATDVARERGYIRRDLIIFKNFDPYRSSDLFMVAFSGFFGIMSIFAPLEATFFIVVAILSRFIHSGVLSYILYSQCKYNAWMNGAKQHGHSPTEAFENWKRVYNMSLVMVHLSFFVVFMKYSTWEYIWNHATSSTLGFVLLLLNIWCGNEIFEVVGEFGWFYGDMFLKEVPAKLEYTGIYRYFNNPETVLGFAGHYGLAIASGSWIVAVLAVLSHISHLLFVHYVEEPFVKTRYGAMRRDVAGVETAIKQIVDEAVESNPPLQKMMSSIQNEFKKRQ